MITYKIQHTSDHIQDVGVMYLVSWQAMTLKSPVTAAMSPCTFVGVDSVAVGSMYVVVVVVLLVGGLDCLLLFVYQACLIA